jgi:hypothetical protein
MYQTTNTARLYEVMEFDSVGLFEAEIFKGERGNTTIEIAGSR